MFLRPDWGACRNGTGAHPCCQRIARDTAVARLRDTRGVRITNIGLDRYLLPLDPPFQAASDPASRPTFADMSLGA